jgi:hypothetical protein
MNDDVLSDGLMKVNKVFFPVLSTQKSEKQQISRLW